VTRVRRAGVDFAAKPDFKLALGDAVRVVGEAAAVDAAARDLGHSPKDLDIPDLIPLSAGIAVGVLLGSIPFAVPGVPVPLKLGLAAGPLLVAIVGGMLHRVGPFVFYLSPGASHVLRDLGIGLFLAAVGLRSGDGFVDQAFSARGLTWMAAGAVITLVPLSIAAAVGTYFLKARYLTLAGVLAGSMTDPPALAFANAQADSDAPSVAYATVYPLTMILRLVCAQALILLTLE
ncbi:MAG: permease, partial [Planctomycetota bacterium]